MARKGSTQKTEVLPIAKQMFALAKKQPDFREQYFRQALRLGDCSTMGEVETKFNESDHHIIFLKSCGVIGDNK